MTEAADPNFSADRIPIRTMGMSSGELFDLTAREVDRVLKEANGSRLEVVQKLLERLRDNKVLTERDTKRLREASELIFSAERGGRPLTEVRSKLLQIHGDILLDAEASRLATTMISVVYATKPDTTIPTLVLIGGVVGSVIGYAVTGTTEGSAAGWAIGSAVGLAIGACISDVA